MEQAVAATPGNADYLPDLGEICISLEEQSRAIEVLAEAATAGANSAAILLRVSKAFERMGNIPYAQQYCHSAHAIDGTSPAVLNQIKRVGGITHPAA